MSIIPKQKNKIIMPNTEKLRSKIGNGSDS